VYFSIITQALTFAFMLLFFRNETGFGGNNGFTDFKTILGFRITDPSTKASLLAVTAFALFGTFVMARWLVTRKFGRVLQAIRDAESRARFCGYDTLGYKLGIWTLAAVISGVAGALYVPQVGIINPSEMSPANSIEVAIWTAVGGRGTLIGPVIGAFIVNGAKSWFTQAFPEYWLFFLGLLFVLVTLFLPRGVVALFDRFVRRDGGAGSAPVVAALVPGPAAGQATGPATTPPTATTPATDPTQRAAVEPRPPTSAAPGGAASRPPLDDDFDPAPQGRA